MSNKTRLGCVLLSGGIDSSTCMAIAAEREYDHLFAISIDYGQRHRKEIESAKTIAQHYNAQHETLILEPTMLAGSLTDTSQSIPDVDYADLSGVSPTYVAFRNGTMLSMVTAFVHGKIIPKFENPTADIYFGAHAEDAAGWAYPDCTPEFIGAMANAIFIGTYQEVRLRTPLAEMDKADIVSTGTNLNLPYEFTWSCYKGGELHCGTCPTCRSRRNGFITAGLTDPTIYAETPDDL